MAGPGRRPGPVLPYRPLAGVEPVPSGWLVAAGRLQGITLAPDTLIVLPTFVEVVDYRPSFEVVALHAPVGLLREPRPGGRRCEHEARVLLGFPRFGAVVAAPCRAALETATVEEAEARNGGMNPIQRSLLGHVGEVAAEMQPYRQRTVSEVLPELSFHQMNGDRLLEHPKHTPEGQAERRAILLERMPGFERLLDVPVAGANVEHVLDAVAALWTARRIASRAVVRIPSEPEWDELGLRMEIVR